MIKKILYTTTTLALTLTVLTIAYAITPMFTTTQTLTVPTFSMQLFQSDGSTAITPAQDITSLWVWNDAVKCFSVDLKIKNVGTIAFTPIITITPITGWTLTTSTLTSIAIGSTLAITITMTPTTSTGGETTGSFVLNFDHV